MSRHTPGLWLADYHPDGAWIIRAGGLFVADIPRPYGPLGTGLDEHAANARLIAQAPAMLDFISRVVYMDGQDWSRADAVDEARAILRVVEEGN